MLTAVKHKKLVLNTLLALLALTFLRVASVFFAPYALQVDEAQYAGWAHHIAAGYYSKPPFIAWALGLGQGVCSVLQIENVEACTRMLQAPAFFLTSLLVAASAWQLFKSRKIAIYSALLFVTTPLAGFYSLVATTDTWLLLWWSLALFAFIQAQKLNATYLPWIVCGLAIGLGLLTKYSMGLFVISSMIWLGWHKKLFNFKPLVAVLVAFLVFLPNILWNIQYGFPTLVHHVQISQVSQAADGGWNLAHAIIEFLSFFSTQFIVFGPWAFLSLLIITFVKRGHVGMSIGDNQSICLLLTFTWPMLGLILMQSVMSRAHGNWAVPAYVSGAILVSAFWGRQVQSHLTAKFLSGRRALQCSVFFGLLFTLFVIGSPHWAQSSPELRASKYNPLRKLQGWKELALWTKGRVAASPMQVLAEDRDLLASLSAYGYPVIQYPLAWNPERHKENHYRWFYDLGDANISTQDTMLLVLSHESTMKEMDILQTTFEKVIPVQDAALTGIVIGAKRSHAYAFEVSGFKGYP